jgi:D-ribose pyranase
VKRSGILNRELAHLVACMGHTDLLVVCDAGFPVPVDVRCVDLALTTNQPRLLDVLEAINQELVVEKLMVEKETTQYSPELRRAILGLYEGIPSEEIAHLDLKALCMRARAVVRTGECTPYANVVLVGGVPY